MKPALQTRLGTGLVLTPQLRQAIRLLQLSQIELDIELQTAAESNPLLELDEAMSVNETEPSNSDAVDSGIEDFTAENWSPGDDESSSGNNDADDQHQRENADTPPSLHEHLRWQLRMSIHSARDEAIGVALIDALDDDGYLREPLEVLAAVVPVVPAVEFDELRVLLRLVQQFDPLGCGASNLGECLDLQLAALPAITPGRELARKLACHHLDAVAKQRPQKLAAALDVEVSTLTRAIALLRSLDPKPGAGFGSSAIEYVQPDAIALKQRGVWCVRMTRSGRALRLNKHYQHLIGHCSRADDIYLRGQLQEARWLIKAVANRVETLQRVAEAIVRTQSDFLDHGLEAMRPLTLREVAESLDLHESTISRATTRKYLRTPRGTFEFKFFFRSGVATEYGGSASSTAVQAMIRTMIETEPDGKPLSDQSLADALGTNGITVARRTVAKYREGLGIPPSSERASR